MLIIFREFSVYVYITLLLFIVIIITYLLTQLQ